MSKVNIWSEAESVEKMYPLDTATGSAPVLRENSNHDETTRHVTSSADLLSWGDVHSRLGDEGGCLLDVSGEHIIIYMNTSVSEYDYKEVVSRLKGFERTVVSNDSGDTMTVFILKLTKDNAFACRYFLSHYHPVEKGNAFTVMSEYADKVKPPYVYSPENTKTMTVKIPDMKIYQDIMMKLGGNPYGPNEYRLSFSKLIELDAMSHKIPSPYPKFLLSKDVKSFISEPIRGFHGELKDLKNIPIDELNIIKNDAQSSTARSASKKTLAEKMEKFGIATLYDLLFHIPRRYIDRSKPQSLNGLLSGEEAVVIGTVRSTERLAGNKGAVFIIDTEYDKNPLRVTFFHQAYLIGKFPTGSKVIITGKLTFFRGERQLNGVSIDHADEAALLPITPVYNQSPSSGLSTKMIMTALREMFLRMGADGIKTPDYLENCLDGDFSSYGSVLKALHFPESMDEREAAVSCLSLIELVYMQVIIKEDAAQDKTSKGISMPKTNKDLQNRVISSLPYSLTEDQDKGIGFINDKMESPSPMSSIILADVGFGKTLVMQCAALRAAESGYQTIIVAPTEILAWQFYQSTVNVTKVLGDDVKVAFLATSLKTAPKREVVKGAKDGSIDIIVATSAALSSSMEYKNLGLVCFDEQQRFGAEDRTSMTHYRSDGRVVDFLMASATPIPRAIAQTFYGDMERIELKTRPAGRKPIVTEWVKQDPEEVMSQPFHEIWRDITDEVKNGHQVYVITPMVDGNDAINAASVKDTFNAIKNNVFQGSNSVELGMLHGKMKSADQEQVMRDFSDGKVDVLVASTIVEVGVDNPNATRVVIMSAGRFGASSLHQIRGRVGRGSAESVCYLVSEDSSEKLHTRLQALVDYTDGPSIAEMDMQMRGEGTIFGASQSGKSTMRFASVLSGREMIEKASDIAESIVNSDRMKVDEALEDAKTLFNTTGRMK